ncbi:hypothetical protein ACQP2P_20915 [Dactylosporangium sp. CA-139114]|uniref:hypothetical protein n=1 Tax=Dactylosporangium sp. CA-139114 TaxID=3239931 RepID=UPI003D989502
MVLVPVAWDRLTVGAGVAYASLVTLPLMVGYPRATPLYVICALLTAVPLAFRDHLDFRALCLLAVVVLVPMTLCGVFFGLIFYMPAALPLVVASLPTPKRYQRSKFVAVGVVLAAVLVLFGMQFARF